MKKLTIILVIAIGGIFMLGCKNAGESGDVKGVTQEIQQKNQSGEPIPDELKNQGKAMGGNR